MASIESGVLLFLKKGSTMLISILRRKAVYKLRQL